MFWKLLHLLPEFLRLAGWSDGRSFSFRDGVTASPFAFLLLQEKKKKIKKEDRRRRRRKVYLVYYLPLLPPPRTTTTTTTWRVLCLRCLSWGWQMRTEKMSEDSSSFFLSFFLSFFFFLGYRKPETSDMICCLSWFVFTFGFTKHEIIPKAEEAKEGEEV